MKIRQKILLNILLKSKSENIEKLAEEFGVSIRTIRNDIEDIAYFLKENNYKTTICLKNKNVSLDFCENEIFYSEGEEDYYNYKLSTGERIVLILLDLLSNTGYITINSISEKLYVSRGTINSDILLIKKWCLSHSVNLISQKGRGFKVNENENRRRFLLSTLLKEHNDLISVNQQDYDPIDIYKKLFRHVDLEEIKEIIVRSENKFQFMLSDIAFDGLLIHIALSIERNIENKVLSLKSEAETISKENEEYRMALYIISEIEKSLNIVLPSEEIYYIALHIYGDSIKEETNKNEEWLYIQLITNNLIQRVSKEFDIDFKSDIRLYEDLSKHIERTIYRTKNMVTLKNPLKDSLISEYTYIYNAVKKNYKKISEYIGQELTDDEIAYIVLHFAAAMERTKCEEINIKPSVLIVCSTGVGTAKLVLSRINKYFNFQIKNVISVHQLKSFLSREKVDFIISTVSIDEVYPHIVVNPLLKCTDIENINGMLLKLGFSANNTSINLYSELASEIYDLVNRLGGKNEEEILISELKDLLEQYKKDKEESKEGGRVLMLSDILKKEYISLNEECSDWVEAVKASGNILLKHGAIENDYIQSAIDNVKELGPYIVITKGVAIPHASNKYGVHKTSISLIRLKEPINFKNSENDPVKYVFMLATTDSNSHILALRDLVNLLEDKDFFRCIDNAENETDIINYIIENESSI